MMEKESVSINLAQAFEPTNRDTYASEELVYSERTAFYLPKASLLKVFVLYQLCN